MVFDRDRDGLLVFFVGVVLLRVAAAVYFLTHLLVAAAPVVMLASLVTVSCVAPNASRRVVRRVFGGAHPLAMYFEKSLRRARAVLRAREE